ncbi:MAG: hypothetical protein ISR78_07950 [Spirochaetia bacterium]|nr:hypothetical protein [Spirochaetia bacterium]
MRNTIRLSKYLRIISGYLFFTVIFFLLSYLGAQYMKTLDKYINFLFYAALYSGAAYIVLGTIHFFVSIFDSVRMKRFLVYDVIFTLIGIGIISFICYFLAVISAL